MQSPQVSVIIPSYNYADFIVSCVQSVLDQTFTDFEVIVVDDGSQDHTAQVIQQFADPRVHYIFQENRGLPGARNTGIKASTGEFLAFLDSDDKYHPRKLETQIAFLKDHPEIGLAYNSRFITDSTGQFLELQRVPASVQLRDLVLGYPFAPSDVVMRRSWAEQVNLFDESYILNSEDLNFHIRLMLAGCRFAGVPDALAYRQLHTGRHFRNITGKVETYKRALDTAFNDPGCPLAVRSLRNQAYAGHYLTWSIQAALQTETTLAQNYIWKAVQLEPTLLEHNGAKLVRTFVFATCRDGGEHEVRLRALFAQLPPGLGWLCVQQEWAVARGYLMRGIRDVMWNRLEKGQEHLSVAQARQASFDQYLSAYVVEQLTLYEAALGNKAAQRVLRDLHRNLHWPEVRANMRKLISDYWINRAFTAYRIGNYGEVPRTLIRSATHDLHKFTNRGAWIIGLHSMYKMVTA